MCEPTVDCRVPQEVPMIPLSEEPEKLLAQGEAAGSVLGVSATEVTEAGEAGGIGGLGKIIWRVFAENKLALVSVGVIVFMLLFCFVGPHLYVTNQTDLVISYVGQALAHPNGQDSARHGPERLRHHGPAHGRRRHGARDRPFRPLGSRRVFGVFFGAVSGFAGGVDRRHHDEDR